MCGRYVLSMAPSVIRRHLENQNMPAEQAPDDEDDRIRQTYNFAPGYHGLIYRANTADRGAGSNDDNVDNGNADGGPSPKKANEANVPSQPTVDGRATRETKYKLQAARWGLIPFWTKRAPDYGSQMKTINCRDDSLIENRGMWNTMKQRKRCIVIAEGFYEWLKKNNGKEKIPHFTKRKDGQLMCFAGLWDMVQYEGSEEKLYTYTVITTDSNKQLKFLHDRMPVILEPGSEAMKMWLDPNNVGWSKELQSLLKPYDGELDCYPVDKGVGKVGNNSPSFVIPVDSKENKKNIANFFGNQKATAKDVAAKNEVAKKAEEVKTEGADIKQDPEENRGTTTKAENTEDNAPLPKPDGVSEEEMSQSINQDTAELEDQDMVDAANAQVEKGIKREIDEVDDDALLKAAESPVKKAIKLEQPTPSPVKSTAKTRSATSNNHIAKTPTKGNAKITSFFGR
ncbi:Abasic site processing protein [Fulvia fulva]|uniref:Abasic site processing protein n=1 Tax=Passalora fulva TaxID=5499 RepID=A0A9Q8PHZ3_PASFU|nr:Abasic site processing protein [Fulvia fulva]KAK4626708.1 Abasic site processing protein [Fulvia fulva]KAK4628074.1 Abasic site processing protein [Fulvia fulva]UJO22815.1 Abasic site processing protein [Fulvia fulva]WPV13173.1 Abasic site processing protein [Fulvia fulva]WPV28922.1 Abasic site processing protein [Fulvia fulva]